MPYSSSTVDEQVVKMTFDNSNFDSNISDSIRALNNLDTRLISLNKDNFKNLTNSIDNLANAFTVKGQIMLGVLTRLGNKIYDLGNRAFRKLTQGIRDGLGEYDKIIESTQTIYQNVKQNGNTIGDVNNALDELNTYADKTIYNFGQMTRMIGQFTSAGVGLKSSVSNIKGLANAAALVGADMHKAQIAWNAVSRAMSSGNFTNITWRSLELSGIAGKQFNKVITEVARNMHVKGKKTGKDIDGMIKKYGSLRESLKEGWLDKKVFTEAMNIMSGAMSDADLKKKGYTKKQIRELRAIADAAEEAATRIKTFKQLLETTSEAIGSGWAQSFRILIGDLEQAKKLYTRISIVLNEFIDNNARIRNELFNQIVNGKDRSIDKKWRTGRDSFRQIIENMQTSILTFFKTVKVGFLNIFPIERISAAARKVLNTVEKFTKSLVLNQKEVNSKDGFIKWDTTNIDKISNAVKDLIRFFRGLASAVDIAWMAISQPIKVIIKRIPFLNNFFENTNSGLIGIVKKLGNFGDKIYLLQNAVKQTNFFGAALEILLDHIDELGKKYPVIGAILWVFKSLKKAVNDIKDGIKKLNIKPFSTAFGVLKFIVTAVWRGLNGIFGLIQNISKRFDFSWLNGPKKFLSNSIKAFSDYGKGLLQFEDIAKKVKDFFEKTFGKVRESASAFFSMISEKANYAKTVLVDSFNSAKNAVKDFSEKVKNGASNIRKQFLGVGDASDQAGGKVRSVWDKIKGFFEGVSEFFKKLHKDSDNTVDGIVKRVALIAGAIAASAFTISTISKTFGKLRVLSNISTLLKSGVDVIKAYQREAQTKTILNIAIAIGILSASLVAMSLLPYEKLESGLIIFASFMATIALTLVPLINSIALLNQSIANRKNITNTQAFFNIFKDVGKKLAQGINAKAFGKACIYFSISIGIIVAAIIMLRKNFDKIDDIEKPAGVIIRLMIAMGVVIGATSIALTILSKSFRKVKAVVNVFSSFFQLVGVSHVIIAISLSIALLVQSLIALSKVNIDKTVGPAGLIFALMSFMGGIAITVSAIISQSKNFGKLKDVALVLVSAASSLGIVILSYIALMKMIESYNPKTWWQPAVAFSIIISQFTVFVSLLLGLSKKVGGNAQYWAQLNKFLIVISACITTLAGMLYLLSFSGKIDDSVVNIISTLVTAATAITILLGILTALSKTSFSTKFIKVIQGISFSISAFTASIGILAAGLALLTSAINSVDVKATDSKNTSNKFIEKIEYVARVIGDSIPALKNLFFKVGQALAEVFGSLIAGFVGKIADIIDQYGGIIDKIINLLIDLIGKVVNALYSRKTELISIFNKVADLIVSMFTNALNQAFRRGESETPIKESTVSKFLGLGAIITTFTAFASQFNTFYTFVKNNAESTAAFLNKLNAKIVGGSAEVAKLTAKNYVVMALAVTAALKAVSLACKGLRQLNGEEAIYVRNDINNLGEAIIAFFTDAEWRAQTFVFTMEVVGRVFVNILRSIGGIIFGIMNVIPSALQAIVGFLSGAIGDLVDGINSLFANLSGTRIKALDDFAKKLSNFAYSIHKSNNDLWKNIGEAGFGGWKDILNFSPGTINSVKQQAAVAGTESGKAFANNYVKATDTVVVPYANNISKKLGSATSGNIDKMSKYISGTISPMLINAKESVTKGSENLGKGITQGVAKGVNETKQVVNSGLSSMCKEGQELMNDLWKRHSPSKVTEELYKDVVMGGVVGINKNKGKLSKAQANMLREQMKIAKSGTGALQAVYKALDITYIPNKIQDTRVDIYDMDEKMKKRVTLNQEYLNIIEQQAKAIEGMSRIEAVAFLKQQALARGLVYDVVQAKNVIDAVLSYGSDHFKITTDGINNVVEQTTRSVEEVVGKTAAAQQLVITDTMNDYNEIMNLAREHSDELVGKKKEEVQEYLYQEALKRGMTEETAKAMSKAATEELFKGKKKNAAITKEELLDKIDNYEEDYKLFCETEKGKTAFLDKMAKARAKIEESGYLEMQEKLRTGKITQAEYSAWAHSDAGAKSIRDYKSAVKELNDNEKAYYSTLNNQRKEIVSKGLKTDEALKKAEEEAKKLLNESESAQRGEYTNLIGQIKNLLGIKVPDLNLKGWNFKTGNGKNYNLKDPKGTDPVEAAKKTKKDLEKQRADLTPTFDLDKLASDASKANGIVMSSLMAAQNASIGDYINKDSELNPFMKDRWQNVYNFTQNNYSPKALSRIDIYRQTQRQLSMSRGF